MDEKETIPMIRDREKMKDRILAFMISSFPVLLAIKEITTEDAGK